MVAPISDSVVVIYYFVEAIYYSIVVIYYFVEAIYYFVEAIYYSVAVIYYSTAVIYYVVAVICFNSDHNGIIATLLHPVLADISIFTISFFMQSTGSFWN